MDIKTVRGYTSSLLIAMGDVFIQIGHSIWGGVKSMRKDASITGHV